MLRRSLSRLLLTALATTVGTQAVATEPGPRASSGASVTGTDSVGVLAGMQRQALALLPLIQSETARAFLQAVPSLPHIEPRTVFHDSARTRYWTAAEAAALPEPQRVRLVPRSLDEEFYYLTRYGSPLAYVRALDLAAAQGLTAIAGRRIADFGYGGIGHLRLLASLGADVVGIEVDSLLRALYAEPGDQGPLGAAGGRVTLLTGHFPAETEILAAVGGNYDLFLSKNTLKRGYIHPEQPTDPRRLVHLGVDDTTFVRNVYRMLVPGGLAVIYNLSPPPNPPGKPYIPWADGRCPFPATLWESAGFQVLVFDRDDNAAARRMGHALEWDRGDGAMDLEHGLFAHYSIFRKPEQSGARD